MYLGIQGSWQDLFLKLEGFGLSGYPGLVEAVGLLFGFRV